MIASLPSALPVGVGTPAGRVMSAGAAYQATDSTRTAFVTLNMTGPGQSGLLSSMQAPQKGYVIMGPTAASVTSASGDKIGQGAIVVATLAITQALAQQVILMLPPGWFFGWAGAGMSLASGFDQAIG